jgi:heparan-alpha-glucosaminide N-acetyltransferase
MKTDAFDNDIAAEGSTEHGVGLTPDGRSASLDAFRGLAILVMVFVNDLGDEAPSWMHHMLPGYADGMTLADLVFPTFLFIVGMAVALSFERELAAGISGAARLGHILIRSASLLCMGVIEVNTPYERTFPPHVWHLLAFASLILAWCVVPREPGRKRQILLGLKVLGVVGVVALLATFRRKPAGTEILFWGPVENWAWLRAGYWGILGQIGWAYLTVAILTLILGWRREWLMGAMGILILIHLAFQPFLPQDVDARQRRFELDFPQRFAADRQHSPPRGRLFLRMDDKTWLGELIPALSALSGGIDELGRYVNLADATGSLAAITMAGCLLGTILRRDSDVRTPGARVRWAQTFIIGLFLAGLVTNTFEGINENAATATFCLWSAAVAATVWVLLYLVLDVAGLRRWSIPFRLAGTNALVAYLLHPMVIWLVRLAGMESSLLAYGKATDLWIVVCGSLGMAVLICLVAGLLGRVGLSMRL